MWKIQTSQLRQPQTNNNDNKGHVVITKICARIYRNVMKKVVAAGVQRCMQQNTMSKSYVCMYVKYSEESTNFKR